MSDAESRREDAKREDWEDKHPQPEVNCPSCLDRRNESGGMGVRERT